MNALYFLDNDRRDANAIAYLQHACAGPGSVDAALLVGIIMPSPASIAKSTIDVGVLAPSVGLSSSTAVSEPTRRAELLVEDSIVA